MTTLDIDSAIRSRAYEYWKADGELHGRDLDYWLKAEAEVRAVAAPADKPVQTKAKSSAKSATKSPAQTQAKTQAKTPAKAPARKPASRAKANA